MLIPVNGYLSIDQNCNGLQDSITADTGFYSEEYADNPHVVTSGKLLPILSNPRMNSYLKELADIRPSVSILQIIGVFPNVNYENGNNSPLG